MEPPLMDALFASQSSSEGQKILVHPDGRGYNIHLQVNGILQRPNLVRMLKKAGAYPSRPEDADIILVDSSQLDGKRLIRTWHHTPGKAVLEFQWLRRSIESRKPLLEDDNWAGAQTTDDGEAIVIDEIAVDGEEAEVEQIVSKLVSRPEGDSPLKSSIRSPLPTPRVTPDESFTRRTNNISATLTADPPPIPSNSMPHEPQRQSPLADIPQQQPQEHDAAYNHANSISPSHQTSNTPQPTSLPSQFIPVLYNSHIPPQTQLAQPATPAPFPPSQFSQAHQFSQQQFSQLSQFPHQFPIAPQSYQFSQLPTQQPPPGQISFMPQPQPMIMPTGLPLSNLGDPQNWSMLMTLMDVLRNSNGGELLQAGQPSPMYAQLEAAPSAPTPIHHAQISNSIFVANDSPSSSSHKSRTRTPEVATSQRPEKKARLARKPHFEKSSRSPSRESLPPVRHKFHDQAIQPIVKAEKLPNKRSSKGKERAVTPDNFASDEDVLAGSDAIPGTPVGPPSRKRTITAEKNPGEVFLDDHGQPLSFFVQVDLQGRSGVVSNIKKHKGKITGSIADADYVILFMRSQTFQGLLSEAQACNKVPIQSAFVTDCIAENALLDEIDYALDTAVFVKQAKRGRPGGIFEFTQAETPLSMKKESKPKKPDAKKATLAETSAKKVKKVKKVTKKSAPAPSKKLTPSSHDAKSPRARESPPPPPLETRQAMRDGKFYFTQPELDYFRLYSQILLDEDPTMSTSALVQAMHKKMPHHSVGSWQMQMFGKLKTQLADIRKKANIAYRKATTEGMEKPTEEERPGPSKKPRLAAHTQSQETLEREDFEVICQYFANGGGDDDDDERVWANLSQHRPCKSAKSWPEYYTAHQNEVYAHIEDLVRSSS